jgi:hypothetical protein
MTPITTTLEPTGLENASTALISLLAEAMAKVQGRRRRPKKQGRLHRV